MNKEIKELEIEELEINGYVDVYGYEDGGGSSSGGCGNSNHHNFTCGTNCFIHW